MHASQCEVRQTTTTAANDHVLGDGSAAGTGGVNHCPTYGIPFEDGEGVGTATTEYLDVGAGNTTTPGAFLDVCATRALRDLSVV